METITTEGFTPAPGTFGRELVDQCGQFSQVQRVDKSQGHKPLVRGLSILSVFHSPSSRRLLEANRWLTGRLNPEDKFVWFAANNTPEPNRALLDPQKFVEIPGVERPSHSPKWIRNAYHHVGALARIFPLIRTRFALILDADLYLVRPGWMEEITRHMEEHALGLFGVPWHPRHTSKIRYFPAHHSLFIDRARVKIEDFDLTPQYDFSSPKGWSERIKNRAGTMVWGRRYNVGSSRDVGYAIYRDYAASVAAECAQPVWREPISMTDRILPERFSLIPKRTGYLAPTGFREAGYFDAEGAGWEEFMWKERPFGFHLRGSYRVKENGEADLKTIESVLKSFV